MVEWLLIIQLMATRSSNEIGPFQSQAACEQAAQAIKGKVAGEMHWACVPTRAPAAA